METDGTTRGETALQTARRLLVEGRTPEQIEVALRARGLDEVEASVAARAARDEAPVAPPAEAPAHACPVHAAWPVTGTCTRCGRFFCAQCLRDAGHLAPLESGRCPECEVRAPVPQGIAGWLVLPALHLIINPFTQGYGVFVDVDALRTVDPAFYPPLVIELLVGLSFVGLGLVAARSFFRKQQRAIQLMQAFYGAQVLAGLIGFGLQGWVAELSGHTGGSATVDLARAVVSGGLWLAYFSGSKRVRATFVEP